MGGEDGFLNYGFLNYIENTGTSTTPVFVLRTGSAWVSLSP